MLTTGTPVRTVESHTSWPNGFAQFYGNQTGVIVHVSPPIKTKRGEVRYARFPYLVLLEESGLERWFSEPELIVEGLGG